MQTLLEVRSDFEDHFLFDTVILGFLTKLGFLELRQEPGVYSRITAGMVHSKLEFVQ